MLCVQPYEHADREGRITRFPCGRCLHCRIQRSREMSLRLVHESKYWEFKSFWTLTYDDNYNSGSLHKHHIQCFIRELRRFKKLSYLVCGEYGEKTFRPHYHMILFGYNEINDHRFTEKGFNNQTKRPFYYHKNWPFGHIDVGGFSRDSARYVCDYIFKAYDGNKGKEYYKGLEPPFRLMSKGIGRRFLEDNYKQIQQSNYITDRGIPCSIPRYYIKRISKTLNDPMYTSTVHAHVVDAAGYYVKRHGSLAVDDMLEGSVNLPPPLVEREQNIANLENRHRKKEEKL